MPKRPDYGDATPEDLARAMMRRARPRKKPEKEQPGPPAQQVGRVMFQRGSVTTDRKK